MTDNDGDAPHREEDDPWIVAQPSEKCVHTRFFCACCHCADGPSMSQGQRGCDFSIFRDSIVAAPEADLPKGELQASDLRPPLGPAEHAEPRKSETRRRKGLNDRLEQLLQNLQILADWNDGNKLRGGHERGTGRR